MEAWNLEEAVEWYRRQGAPGDQTAVKQLLQEVQREFGGSIPSGIVEHVAAGLGVKPTFLLALIRRIPSLRLADTHVLEMCAGPNCGKAAELVKLAESAKAAGGSFTLKFVPCMRLCGKGPNARFDGQLYHKVTKEQLLELLSGKQ